MGYSFRFTDTAEADLNETLDYIASNLHNPKAATDFADKITAAMDRICSFPESCPLMNNEFLPETRVRKKLIGNYALYYLSVESESIIHVLRIVYQKRDINETDVIT